MKVSLEDVIEGLEFASDECAAYLSVGTGELVLVTAEAAREAEHEDGSEDPPEWMSETMAVARDVAANPEKYLALPNQREQDRYGWMAEFCEGQSNGYVRDRLLSAIRGRGAFRRFKDEAHSLRVIDQWYAYRDACLRRFAEEWCEENGIEFERAVQAPGSAPEPSPQERAPVHYSNDVATLTAKQLQGFFVGWPRHPDPEMHLEILRRSHTVWLAMEGERCVGFANAISDGLLAAFIPLLEVLPEWQGRGIGAELLRRMLESLDGLYAIDTLCDEDVAGFYDRRGFQRCVGMARRDFAQGGGRASAV